MKKLNAQDRIILMINAGRNIKMENNKKSDYVTTFINLITMN